MLLDYVKVGLTWLLVALIVWGVSQLLQLVIALLASRRSVFLRALGYLFAAAVVAAAVGMVVLPALDSRLDLASKVVSAAIGTYLAYNVGMMTFVVAISPRPE